MRALSINRRPSAWTGLVLGTVILLATGCSDDGSTSATKAANKSLTNLLCDDQRLINCQCLTEYVVSKTSESERNLIPLTVKLLTNGLEKDEVQQELESLAEARNSNTASVEEALQDYGNRFGALMEQGSRECR